METAQLEIREYLTNDGKAPFSEWLNGLKDRKARALIRVRLDRVKLGNLGDCKAVGQGVSELRIDYGPGYRVYIGRDANTVIILLCGGAKGTQGRDIQKAVEYWHDYRERKK